MQLRSSPPNATMSCCNMRLFVLAKHFFCSHIDKTFAQCQTMFKLYLKQTNKQTNSNNVTVSIPKNSLSLSSKIECLFYPE